MRRQAAIAEQIVAAGEDAVGAPRARRRAASGKRRANRADRAPRAMRGRERRSAAARDAKCARERALRLRQSPPPRSRARRRATSGRRARASRARSPRRAAGLRGATRPATPGRATESRPAADLAGLIAREPRAASAFASIDRALASPRIAARRSGRSRAGRARPHCRRHRQRSRTAVPGIARRRSPDAGRGEPRRQPGLVEQPQDRRGDAPRHRPAARAGRGRRRSGSPARRRRRWTRPAGRSRTPRAPTSGMLSMSGVCR